MAQHLIKRYFNNRAYYRLRGSASIDNPDSASARMCAISLPSRCLPAHRAERHCDGGRIRRRAMPSPLPGRRADRLCRGRHRVEHPYWPPLIGLNYHQYQKEADFRYGLVRVRDNAESLPSIAAKSGSGGPGGRLGAAVLNMLDIIAGIETLPSSSAATSMPQPPASLDRRPHVYARRGGIRRRHQSAGRSPSPVLRLADRHTVRAAERLLAGVRVSACCGRVG